MHGLLVQQGHFFSFMFIAMIGVDGSPRNAIWQAPGRIIRNYGGDIKETYGVLVEETCRGIESGVRKINIDTDGRAASQSGHCCMIVHGVRTDADPSLARDRLSARSICG